MTDQPSALSAVRRHTVECAIHRVGTINSCDCLPPLAEVPLSGAEINDLKSGLVVSPFSYENGSTDMVAADLMRRALVTIAERDATIAALVEAASKIRHWHDTSYNKETGKTEGMIVSAEAVFALWEVLKSPAAAAKVHLDRIEADVTDQPQTPTSDTPS